MHEGFTPGPHACECHLGHRSDEPCHDDADALFTAHQLRTGRSLWLCDGCAIYCYDAAVPAGRDHREDFHADC